MWSFEHTAETPAPPRALWRVWTDIPSWPGWDRQIERATFDGPFAVGSEGRLKPRGGPETGFVLTEVDPERRFAAESPLPGAKMRFDHELEPLPGGGTRFTQRVSISGLMGNALGRAIGDRIADGTRSAMAELARVAAE